jgi:hypothetical protein
MNQTAGQLYGQYRQKLLWISRQDGGVLIGQVVGLTGTPDPRLYAPEDLLVWLVPDLSAFFTNKVNLPEDRHVRVRPSQIADISVLDWNETGVAKQLCELAGLRWMKIKKAGGATVRGVLRGFKIPEGHTKPNEAEMLVYQVQAESEYEAYVKEIMDPHSKNRLIHLCPVVLGEVSTIDILRNPSDVYAT